MLVGPNDGRVDHQMFQVGIAAEGLHDARPDAGLGPAVEPLERVVPVSEPLGQVTPGYPGAGDPEHGADEEPIVLGGGSGRLGPPGQEMFDANPLFIRHLEAAGHGNPPWEIGSPVLPGFPRLNKLNVNTT